jgi:hypothetical protein
MRTISLSAVALMTILSGCHTSTTRVETREKTVPVQREAATADDYIAAVQAARTPAEEADAIRSLRQWEVRNGLTYRIRTIRIEDNALVDASSVNTQPVRAEVTIFRGREVLRTFSFPVNDNRNLALFGE